MSEDSRVTYIISLSVSYFKLNVDFTRCKLQKIQCVNEFLNDISIPVLIVKKNLENELQFTNEIQNLNEKDNHLVLFKKSNEAITEKNFATNIFVTSLNENPLHDLFYFLHRIFIPLVDHDFIGKYKKQIQISVHELEKNLQSCMLEENSDESEEDQGLISGVFSLIDEIMHWEKNEDSNSKSIMQLLEPLASQYSNINNESTFEDIDDLLEETFNVLDDIWRLEEIKFPQDRMANIMNLIGSDLSAVLQKKLAKCNLWNEEDWVFSHEQLQSCVSLGKKWYDMCEKLTKVFWRNCEGHFWTRQDFEMYQLKGFSNRLEQIHKIILVHHQCKKLLTENELNKLQMDSYYEPLKEQNPIYYNEYTEHLWEKAVQRYETKLIVAEEKVAMRLRQYIMVNSGNTPQILELLVQYKELLSRPTVRDALVPERTAILQQVKYQLTLLIPTIEEKQVQSSLFVSPVVENLIRVKQRELKIQQIVLIQSTFEDLAEYEILEGLIKNSIRQLKQYQNEQIRTWNSEIINFLKGSEFRFNENEVVVYFEEGKLMRVNYPLKVVKFITETRQIASLGFPIKKEILDTIEKAKKFVHYAKELTQVSTFHNTIGDRIIKSQKAMLLTTARKLAGLVQKQNTVTWSNNNQIEEYILKLKCAVQLLAKQNKKLAYYHDEVMHKIELLMNFHLYKQQDKWRRTLKDIDKIVLEVENQFSDTKTWKIHINYQIYKALEYQFIYGVVDINSILPEIRVELQMGKYDVACVPNLRHIRRTYLKNLKKIMMQPQTFLGKDEKKFFLAAVEHAHHLQIVFKRAEETLKRLDDFIKLYHPWVAVATYQNSDTYFANHVKNPEDFDRQFKICKSLGQQVAKLPRDHGNIGCFKILTEPLISGLEMANMKFWKDLVSNIGSDISENIVAVQTFISDANSLLQEQPIKLLDVAAAHHKYQEVVSEANKMASIIDKIEDSNNVLRAWTKESIAEVENIRTSWSSLNSTVNNFKVIIKKQTETLKECLKEDLTMLKKDIDRFILRWNELKPNENSILTSVDYNHILNDSISKIKDTKQEWEQINIKIIDLLEDFRKFEIERSAFPDMDYIHVELNYYEKNWFLLDDFKKDVDSLANEEWLLFRKAVNKKTEEVLSDWQEKVNEEEISAPFKLKILHEIGEYREVLQNIKYLTGDYFSHQHWRDVFELLGQKPKPIELITFGDFLFSLKLIKSNLKRLKEINDEALNQNNIKEALTELEVWEFEAKFITTLHVDYYKKSVEVIKGFKSIFEKIGDFQSLLQSLKGITSNDQFAEKVQLWEIKLTELDSQLRILNNVQRKWVYLEPLLGSNMLESKKFKTADIEFKEILSNLAKYDFKVMALLKINTVAVNLQNLMILLEQCQNNVLDYLEDKRLKFPRFYFVSDDTLLEILSHSTNENVIQSHIKKIFPAVHSVVLDEDRIAKICSMLGEEVQLNTSVRISEDVESWLETLDNEIKATLKSLVTKCLIESNPFTYPSQVLCLSAQIKFTRKCEHAIASKTLSDLQNRLEKLYGEYSGQMIKWSLDKSDPATLLVQAKLKALLNDNTYNIEVVKSLIDSKATSLNDWEWQKTLRYYFDDKDNIIVKMSGSEFIYSYEYQGNYPRLVSTSLTNSCYLILTQALKMGLGGNLYGPAGTGKTESVKSLGSLLGRQVLVFNCDEGLDVHSLTRILIGLVKCGAWGCFDEFNRLEEATLSLISEKINIIQNALVKKRDSIKLLSKQVCVNKNTGVFITFNPAEKGYGGRQKLPETVKTLFRPIAMFEPNSDIIAEVTLRCEGFKVAEVAAKKLVSLYDTARVILSHQHHYDWSLRSLKTILDACGDSLRKYLISHENIDKKLELKLVSRAVRLNMFCKLTYSDRKNFDRIMEDYFPNSEIVSNEEEEIKTFINEAFSDINLAPNETQITKCMELYEQLKQRKGVVIVGPPNSGKSTIIYLLKQALIRRGDTVKHEVLNPKSMDRSQLLGHIDLDTRQWFDGVLTRICQSVVSEPSDVLCWIHCDGDIDPTWIESLNSVLDDNHLLTLPSGWRIQFGANVRFLFETHNLAYASPATISRMGIVLLSEEDLNIDFLTNSWLSDKFEDSVVNEFVSEYLSKDVFSAITWIRSSSFLIQTPLISTVRSFMSLITKIKSKTHFVALLINGLSSNMTLQSRKQFIKEVSSLTGEILPDSNKSLYYDSESDTIRSYEDGFTQMNEMFVYIPFMLVTKELVNFWLSRQESVILVGPTGVGKRTMLHQILTDMSNHEYTVFNCSYHLLPKDIIQKIRELCYLMTSSNRKVYRPKNKEYLTIHFAGVNQARTDNYGTKLVIEFLRQVLTNRGFYDENMEWVGIQNINFVFSATSLETLSPRFISVNHICYMRNPDEFELFSIFRCFANSMHTNIEPFVRLMFETFIKIRDHFQGRLINESFNLRDLIKWCRNVNKYNVETEHMFLESIVHESHRIFRDKLQGVEDCNEFDVIMEETFAILGDSFRLVDLQGFYFVCDKPENKDSNITKLSGPEWTKLLKHLVTISGDNQFSEVVFIPELLELISKIDCAILHGEGMMISGKPGFGRKTAVKLAALRHNATIVQLKTFDKHSKNNFRHELKNVIQSTGVNDEKIFLILEDYKIQPDTLSLLNSLLSGGEVPGLFKIEEFNNIIIQLREVAAQINFDGTLPEFLARRVRKNLHLIISFDDQNKTFLELQKTTPFISNNLYCYWAKPFRLDTLREIPKLILSSNDDRNAEQNKMLDLSKYFVALHNDTLTNEAKSPLTYFQLIQIYQKLENRKVSTILNRQAKLKAGIEKIIEARRIVDSLKEDASTKKRLLDEKQTKCKLVLDKITETMANANLKKSELENLKQQTEKENETLQIRKTEIDDELADIEPTLQEVRAAVGNIKAESLHEMRSLRAPPAVVRDILEGVLRLMGIEDTSWNSMKIFLSKRGVKEDIRLFDAARIRSEHRISVQKLLEVRGESFTPLNAKRASVAAAPLAAWVKANVHYSLILEKIRPLTEEQERLKRNIETADMQMDHLSVGLKSVDEVVCNLKDQLNASSKEAAEIEFHLNNVEETIAAAEGLVEKLDEEYLIWIKELEDISINEEKLKKSCMLAAGFITYLSNSPDVIRRKTLAEWKKLLNFDDPFSLNEFLASEEETMEWESEGLPQDEFSRQNALIILNTTRTPLILDPSVIATPWLINHFKNEGLETTSPHSQNYYYKLELSIRFGKLLLIEIDDNIPFSLMSIMTENFVFQDGRKMMFVGEKLVNYNSKFRLFLVTHNTAARVFSSTTLPIPVVNFRNSTEGFKQQLIASALNKEKPSLEKRRLELVINEKSFRSKLHEMRENILKELASSHGDILRNKDLLLYLNETKKSSHAIMKSLQESSTLKSEMKEEYDSYKPLADFAYNLFEACLNLSNINSMYSLSASAFKKLFIRSLSTCQASDDIDVKRHSLLKYFYNYLARSFYKEDRLAFALHLCHSIYPDMFGQGEWDIFIGKPIVNSNSYDAGSEEFVVTWVEKDRVSNVERLQNLPRQIYENLKLNDCNLWRTFMRSEDIVTPGHCELSPFQLVLVIQALRPDKLYSALKKFALESLELQSLSPPTLSMSNLLEETTAMEPILFITCPGTDPSQDLKDLALKNRNVLLKELALGPGSEEDVLKLLSEATANGFWVVLKNLHLVSSWLPSLEKEMQAVEPHDNFRLWFTTEPYTNFPPSFLSMCLKVVYESPTGIKRNLQRTYNKWISNANLAAEANTSQLLFSLAWFHAVVQERRTYIPQGWTSFYEFNDLDLDCALQIIMEFSKGSEKSMQLNHIRELLKVAVYGGRINNCFDLRVLHAYVEKFFDSGILEKSIFDIVPGVRVSTGKSIKEHLKTIEVLPETDLPQFFGLPLNVDRIWQRIASSTILDQLKELENKQNHYIHYTFKEKYNHVVNLLKLWKNINAEKCLLNQVKVSVDQENSPIGIFFVTELNFAIDVINNVHQTLKVIAMCLKTCAFSNNAALNMADTLQLQQVPEEWENVWGGPKNTTDYIKKIINKAKNIEITYNNWKKNQSEVIELSCLFNLGSFLMSLKQQAARHYNCTIESLCLQTSFEIKDTSFVQGSALLSGIYLEGAIIDNNKLSPIPADSSTKFLCPQMIIFWMKKGDTSEVNSYIYLPLYKHESRKEVITQLRISCHHDEIRQWILAGTSFFVDS